MLANHKFKKSNRIREDEDGDDDDDMMMVLMMWITMGSTLPVCRHASKRGRLDLQTQSVGQAGAQHREMCSLCDVATLGARHMFHV